MFEVMILDRISYSGVFNVFIFSSIANVPIKLAEGITSIFKIRIIMNIKNNGVKLYTI